MDLSSRSKISSKIRKLIAIGDPSKNNSIEEAQSALAKARKLMLRHNIEEASLFMDAEFISGSNLEAQSIVAMKKCLGTYSSTIERLACRILVAHLNVRVIIDTANKAAWIFGTHEDTKFSSQVFHCLIRSADALSKSYTEMLAATNDTNIRSLVFGFFDGIDKKMSTATDNVKKDLNGMIYDDYQRVLAANKIAIEDAVKTCFPTANYHRITSSDIDMKSFHHGSLVGNSFDLILALEA